MSHSNCVVVVVMSGLALAMPLACKKSPPPPPQGSEQPRPDPSANAKKAAPKAELTWKVAALRDDELRITRLDDVVAVNGSVAIAFAPSGKQLSFDPASLKGLPARPEPGYAFTTVGGRYPNDVWMIDTTSYERAGGRWSVLHLTEAGFTEVATDDPTGGTAWFYDDVQPWSDGSFLAHRLHAPRFTYIPHGTGGEFVVASGTTKNKTPEITKEAIVDGWVSFASGDVAMLIGYDGVVQRFVPGDSVGVREKLPGLAENESVYSPWIRGTGKSAIYVGGNLGMDPDKPPQPYLARFDGKTWQRLDVAGTGVVTMATEESDGTRWMILRERADGDPYGKQALYRSTAEKPTFELVKLPDVQLPAEPARLVLDYTWRKLAAIPSDKSWHLTPIDLVVAKDDRLWLTAHAEADGVTDRGLRTLVFTTGATGPMGPTSSIVTMPGDGEIRAILDDQKPDRAPTKGESTSTCPSLFLTLEEVAKEAPADYDPKALLASLAALPKYAASPDGAEDPPQVGEAMIHGARVIGIVAVNTSFNFTRLEGVAKNLTPKPASAPKLLCKVPRMLRGFDANIGTPVGGPK